MVVEILGVFELESINMYYYFCVINIFYLECDSLYWDISCYCYLVGLFYFIDNS